MKTQKERIKLHLMSGKSLTPIEALNKFGCFRLGARIWELSKKEGFCIESELVETRDGKHVARYRMV